LRRVFAVLAVVTLLAGCAPGSTVTGPGHAMPDGFVADARGEIVGAVRPSRDIRFVRDISIRFERKTVPARKEDLGIRLAMTDEIALVAGASPSGQIAMTKLEMGIWTPPAEDRQIRVNYGNGAQTRMDAAWGADCRTPRLTNFRARARADAPERPQAPPSSRVGDKPAVSPVLMMGEILSCFPSVSPGGRWTVSTRALFDSELMKPYVDGVSGDTRFEVVAIGRFAGRRAFLMVGEGTAGLDGRFGTPAEGKYSGHKIYDAATGILLQERSTYYLASKDGKFDLRSTTAVDVRDVK